MKQKRTIWQVIEFSITTTVKITIIVTIYQKILHVLKEIPKNQVINFIIDWKTVIDVFNNLPSTYKDRQNTLYLNTLI